MLIRVLLCLGAALASTAAPVVINEIMYHPPRDRDELQFVELYNAGDAAVDLSGWRLGGGVKFTFPAKTKLSAKSFVIVARDTNSFQRAHNSTSVVVGNFTGKLSHKGEKLQLVDAAGNIVEALNFLDVWPWPLAPDGYGSSLERICVTAPANDPSNWSGSLAASALRPSGSPGEANTVASAEPLPVVQNVRFEKLLAPNKPLDVSADIKANAALEQVTLQYTLIRPGQPSPASDLPMRKASGSSYIAQIPTQPAGTLIRFTIQATDKSNNSRIEPASAEPRPAFSAYVIDKIERGRIPQVTVVNSETLRGGGNNKFGPARRTPKSAGKSAVLYVPPQGDIQLFDFVQVRRRAGGLKIHCFRDQPLDEMTAFNLIFEGPPRWVLSEHLSYELYRKAGMNIQKSGHARLTVDGRSLGYYLMVEQPNKHFLERSGRDDSGNLYKILWFGRGIVDQHEKKTNPGTGHDDIVTLIETLRKKSGAAQWAYINEQLNVDAFVNYYAVNMCIENWDGFFNNHFVYHDLKPGGKWDIIPWDEDKTWGEYDGGPRDYSWYDMPLTIGSAGDRPQRSSSSWFGGGGGAFGGEGWWRPAGFLSGPLLSNPQFRQRFEARLRELCGTVFNAEKFGPIVKDLQARLRSEVEFKAKASRQDSSWAVKQFDGDIASFERQLVNRRKYILSQLGK